MKNWADLGFKVEYTADGSPSLRLLEGVSERFADGEAMHHSGGALTESEYIYTYAIQQAQQSSSDSALSYLVVGLGVGYIELLIARESLRSKQKIQAIRSYESVPELIEFFFSWLRGEYEKLNPEVLALYNQVIAMVESDQSRHADMKQVLLRYLDVKPAIEAETFFDFKAQVILYDAFSSKTSPHLWEEEFLVRFLNEVAFSDRPNWFSTYGCKGTLKRALKREGFVVHIRTGFKSKRDAIFATKL